MEVVAGVSLRPSPARIGKLSSVDSLVRPAPRRQPARRALVVEARGGRSWSERQQLQQRRAPQLPKIEDDGNPRFVIFIRTANVSACLFVSSPIHCHWSCLFQLRIPWRLIKICVLSAGLLLVPAQRFHRRHDGQDHARGQGQLPRQVHLQGHARQEPRRCHLQSTVPICTFISIYIYVLYL
jgi:hypothetical protein